MRVTLVEPDGEGGLAHFAHELGAAIAAQGGHDVRLITSQHYELTHLPHSFEVAPIMRLWSKAADRNQKPLPAVRRKVRRAARGARLTWEWARMARRVLADRPDIVLFSEVLFPHLGIFLWFLRKRGIKLAQICHEFAYQEREGRRGLLGGLANAAARRVYPQFDWIFFLSEATRTSFHERFAFPKSRTARIPHGSQNVFPPASRSEIAFRAELGLSEAEPVVLFFGGIRPSKGVPDLIDAFGQSRWRDRAKLVIAGQPTGFMNMAAIEDAIASNHLGGRVVLRTGYIPMEDVASYFEIATTVVLPYQSATQSGVLHLAYEFARPVIATRVGGLAEDVRDGSSGYLVTPGDARDLAARIDAMLDEPALALEMGRRGFELSRSEFTWAEAARIMTGCFTERSLAGGTVHGECGELAETPAGPS